MAKNRKSHSRSSLSSTQRNLNTIANVPLLPHSTLPKSNLDGRLHQPATLQQIRTAQKRLLYMKAVLSRPKPAFNTLSSSLSSLQSHVAPLRRAICQSRHERRQVLHALKKTGSGGARKKPRRTWKSSVKC